MILTNRTCVGAARMATVETAPYSFGAVRSFFGPTSSLS